MKKIILSMCVFVGFVFTAVADNDIPITVDQLPKPAKQLIETYFSDTKVSYAKKETEMLDKSYEVIFTNGSKIEFDSKGKWKDIKCKTTKVPDGIIPQKIKAYVDSNYPEVNIIEIDKDRTDYEVKLTNGLELKFDLKFNLIKIDD